MDRSMSYHTEDEVSEAGDIGDRALSSNSLVSPVVEDMTSPLFTSPSQARQQEDRNLFYRVLEYLSCLIHLAVFGILGVITRYLLQKLFGREVAGVTSDKSILYLDLPSNMVGSFLMGWLGIVFKGNISHVSEHLAIGLTTGYLGSLTTFSGWNQKMLDLAIDGKWVHAFCGFFIGLFLAAYSIIFGIETAEGFRWLSSRVKTSSRTSHSGSSRRCRVNSFKRQILVLVALVLILCFLWGGSGLMLKKEFHKGGSRAQLWLACLVGPAGVWIRWLLAKLNGRGLGKAGVLKWVPFGTLIANVSAACVMAALATTKKVVNTKTCDTVASGIQLGLLGCLSTVSTFIAEFYAMRQSSNPWRAYAYATLTIAVPFILGILIYAVPVWTKGYN